MPRSLDGALAHSFDESSDEDVFAPLNDLATDQFHVVNAYYEEQEGPVTMRGTPASIRAGIERKIREEKKMLVRIEKPE